MNKYSEVKKRPSYSYKIQKLANALPIWSTARKDRHSNYQTILSDLTDPILDVNYYAKLYTSRMLAVESDNFDSSKLYKYSIVDPPKEERESYARYKAPILVSVSDNTVLCDSYPLTECPNKSAEDLNNRLPLEIKALTPKAPPVVIVSYDGLTKEACIFVQEICYLGFQLSSETELIPENFYMKQDNTYAYSSAYLKNMFNVPLQAIKLLPFRQHNFIDAVHPGIYYVSFDLIEATQLDGFTLDIYSNFTFPLQEKTFFYDNYLDLNTSRLVYTSINGDYLELVEKNPRAHSELNNSLGALESFALLDETDATLTPSAYVRQEMLMYVLSNDNPNKLYCYDLFLNGNSYVYEENDKYLYDIVLENVDYKVDDEIIIESRRTKSFSRKKIRSIRLKIENYESSADPAYTPLYVDESGNILTDDAKAWRDISDYEKKWKFTIDNIGSYKFTIECLHSDNTISIGGVKLMLVNYKVPYKVFNLDGDYTDWQLGISPDNRVELVNSSGARKVIEFYKDGYYFDEATGEIWTNYPFTSINVEYS